MKRCKYLPSQGAHAPHGGSTGTLKEEGGAWAPGSGVRECVRERQWPPKLRPDLVTRKQKRRLKCSFSLNLKRNSIENFSEIRQIQLRHCCHSTISLQKQATTLYSDFFFSVLLQQHSHKTLYTKILKLNWSLNWIFINNKIHKNVKFANVALIARFCVATNPRKTTRNSLYPRKARLSNEFLVVIIQFDITTCCQLKNNHNWKRKKELNEWSVCVCVLWTHNWLD